MLTVMQRRTVRSPQNPKSAITATCQSIDWYGLKDTNIDMAKQTSARIGKGGFDATSTRYAAGNYPVFN